MPMFAGPAAQPLLRNLDVEIAQMGALAEKQLSEAISAFERCDVSATDQIVAGDAQIDAAHLSVERNAVSILSQSRLSQEALRQVLSAIKVAGELERVGDLAKNVAKRTRVISQDPPTEVIAGVARMGRKCRLQLSHVLDAYASRNTRAGQAVWGGDDDLDALYNSLFQATLKSMMRDPAQVSACTHLVFIAKNFERVGDHATNIAEILHFLVTGDQMTSVRPKGDETATTAVSAAERR